MKNKIAILIVVSILVLIALSSIQAYLISNTYQLKREAFIKETGTAIAIIDEKDALDSLYSEWGEDLKNHLSDYKNGRLSKDMVVQRLKATGDSLNPAYKKLFKQEFDKIDLGYQVDFKVNVASIVILDRNQNDTIYASMPKDKIRLFGEDFKEDEANVVRSERWFTQHEFITQEDGLIRSSSFDLEVRTQNVILIKDWKRIVYGRMAGLFIGSAVLFLFVIGLLYYSIKNLVTQKKIAEIKTDFINNITHELKTPLATLSIASKTLKNKEIKANLEAFENTLNIVDRKNGRLQKLIDQVLTNSLSSKEIVLNKEQVVDNIYFNNLVEDFKLSVQHQNVHIDNSVCDAEVLLRIDKFHFTTAIFNIMENAVKYGREETKITLKTDMRNGTYVISLTDNGIGISEKDQKNLFEKFYRAGEGNVHDVKGLGLGLYYTNQIIKAHNGSIAIDSELGSGSTFTIKIPLN